MTRPTSNSATDPFPSDSTAVITAVAAILTAGALRLARAHSATLPTTVNLPKAPESSHNSVDDPAKSWLHVQRVNATESAAPKGVRT